MRKNLINAPELRYISISKQPSSQNRPLGCLHLLPITYYFLLSKNPVLNFILGKSEEVRSKK